MADAADKDEVISELDAAYLEYLDQEMQATVPGYDDAHFFNHLPAYDNADNLWDWYNMLETDPLLITEEKDEELEEEVS